MLGEVPPIAGDAPASLIVNRQSSIVNNPRIALFTPLSPVASGISYYSEELLPTLARAARLDVYLDGYAPTEGAALRAAGVGLRDRREFARTQRREPYDAIVYQMGNSPAHAYMYDLALREPGIVVLHDVVLHHLRLWMAVNRGRARRREYADDLARLYGAAGAELARAVLLGQTPPTLFDYPLVEPVIDAARAIIVHNAASAERVRALRPGARVRVVPMGVPLPSLPVREEARARLGVDADAFLVVSHGHVNPYKRLDVALRAFRRLADARPDARFLIAGSVAPGLDAALDRQVRYLGLGGRVRRLGFIPPETVADLLGAADCCINLRYPSAGETSASLLRIMGAGLPVLVSDAGSFRELPPGSCIKIPVGPTEEPLLAEYLIALARDEALRLGIGAAARAFVAEEHSLERSASGYLDLLGDLLGCPLALPVAEQVPAPPVPQIGSGQGTASPRRSLRDLIRNPQSAIRNLRNLALPPGVSPSEGEDNPLVSGVAGALAELGLAGHGGVERSVAGDLVALGLGVGMQRKDVSEAGEGWGTDSSLRSA